MEDELWMRSLFIARTRLAINQSVIYHGRAVPLTLRSVLEDWLCSGLVQCGSVCMPREWSVLFISAPLGYVLRPVGGGIGG